MTADEKLRTYPFEAFRGELPAELLAMVRDEPVSRVQLPDGRPVWLVVGYDEVCTALADPRLTRHTGADTTAGQCPVAPRVRELGMNGPAHTSLRRLAARAFTARRIEAYRPRVQQITDGLLDAMVAGGQPGDLISALVAPLPALVVCEVLGVPADDRERFNAWVADINSLTAYGSPEAARSSAELRAYLFAQLSVKRASPGEDLLSAWLAAQADDELSDEEIVGLAVGVLIGGREINSTSAGIRALFQHPEQLARLRAEPDLLPRAVEEILRHTSVSPMFLVQTALEDLTLDGVRIRAGDAVMAVPWAANRHPGAFPDPDTFDVGRSPGNPHLTFGYGPHFCLGAALGRLQMEIAIGTLLRRFPNLAPAVGMDELPWRHERINCGIAEFPVTW
ncbi:cytochrome P450 [Micromonospora sonneratiae]|uniref:Cytochrome P450 n=1 Tax=Micromonospora sonneratiae TaxID=1184706 RepID=A0ABW3Y8B1_9ACTN